MPRSGAVKLSFGRGLPATFAVRVRVGAWAVPATLRVGDDVRTVAQPGWCEVPARTWRDGDALLLTAHCGLARLADRHDDERAALQWGPCVLALEAPGSPVEAVGAVAEAPRGELLPGPALRVACDLPQGERAERLVLGTFAEAGAGGADYRVWLTRHHPDAVAVVRESRSRVGNVAGAIGDRERDTFVVTYDGAVAAQDWYAIAFDAPEPVREVVFAHGHCFHDGGWFDAANGKPSVQVRSAVGGEWTTIGSLADYPATTSTTAAGLTDGQVFTLRLAAPVLAREVRVVGVPASGDRAAQAFSSCAELSARR